MSRTLTLLLTLCAVAAAQAAPARTIRGYLNLHVVVTTASMAHTIYLSTSSHPEGFTPAPGDLQLEAATGVKNLFTVARQIGPLAPIDVTGVDIAPGRFQVTGLTASTGAPPPAAFQRPFNGLPFRIPVRPGSSSGNGDPRNRPQRPPARPPQIPRRR